MIQIIDDVLVDPVAYRSAALAQSFGSVTFGSTTFHGILICRRLDILVAAAEATSAIPVLSFFRKSPKGQVEPNYIHSDKTMGHFTGIYYMNPEPPAGDGTDFWESGQLVRHVEAKFNRLLVFDAALDHSRALFDNYGDGDTARLIQVVFLK